MNRTSDYRSSDHRFNFTIEAGLWIAFVLIALTMRIASLDAAPLARSEAQEAMSAWYAVSGQSVPLAPSYSPLLFAGNRLFFFLFGASDALARLWSAIFGSLLVLTPLLLRRRLGRWGALVAGGYLVLSPTALVASRHLDGTIVAACGVMIGLGSIVRYLDSERHTWLACAAVGLALALTGGAAAYGFLLSLILACALTCYVLVPRLEPSSRLASYLAFPWGAFLLPFAATLLIIATALGWNPTGFSTVGELLVDWLARFRPASNPAPSPFVLLLAYEPLVFALSLGGAIWWAIRGGHTKGWDALWLTWAGIALLLLLLMPGRAPLDLLWVVLPLAFVLGSLVERVIHTLHLRPLWLGEGIYALIVLIFWVHTYLNLARYATYARVEDLVLILLSLLIQVIVLISFALTIDDVMAFRAGMLSTGVALLALTLSAGWRVAYVNPAAAEEALLKHPTDPAVRDLVQTVTTFSWRETGLPTTLSFVYQAPPDSTLAWYLREFESARRVEHLSNLRPQDLSLLLVAPGREASFQTETDYIGQSFVKERSWTPQAINCNLWSLRCVESIRWFVFRDTPAMPSPASWVTIWRESSE